MAHTNKHMVLALAISVMFVIFNILAVTQGTAHNYISLIGEFVNKLLP
ncbi:MAG: hypothetical protein LJE83_10140 [Gammaproteobacteria bacterium]|nr:hypothetical protein [Gammaproteobacteria bacterium]